MSRAIELPSGRTIAVDECSDTVTFRAATGACILTVRLTEAGPVLVFESAAIQVAAEAIDLRAGRMQIAARELDIDVTGDLRMAAGRDVSIAATRGAIDIEANDDVDVRAERVRLNCDDPPMPLSWDEHRRRIQAKGDAPRQLLASSEEAR